MKNPSPLPWSLFPHVSVPDRAEKLLGGYTSVSLISSLSKWSCRGGSGGEAR